MVHFHSIVYMHKNVVSLILGLPNIILHWSQRSERFHVVLFVLLPYDTTQQFGFASGSQHEGQKSGHRMIFWQQLLLLLRD